MTWRVVTVVALILLVLSIQASVNAADGFKCHKCSGKDCQDPFWDDRRGVTVDECSVFKGKPMCMKAISKGKVTRQCMEGTSCTLIGADTYRAWCCDEPFCNTSAPSRHRPHTFTTALATFLVVSVILHLLVWTPS